MKIHRLAVTGLAVLAAASLSLTACGGKKADDKPAAAASSAAVLAPKEALVVAAAKLVKESFTVTGKFGSTGHVDGVVDPAAHATKATLLFSDADMPMKFESITIGADSWARTDMGPLAAALGVNNAKWYRFDSAKVAGMKAARFTAGGDDPLVAADLIGAVTTVQRVDDSHFTGVIDLSKLTSSNLIGQDDVAKLGVKANTVPFQATLDSQGRLVGLKVDLPAGSDVEGPIEITYSKFGQKVDIAKPAAADVVEASENILKAILGS